VSIVASAGVTPGLQMLGARPDQLRDTFAIDLNLFTLFRSAIQILAFFTIIPYFYEHIYDNIFE